MEAHSAEDIRDLFDRPQSPSRPIYIYISSLIRACWTALFDHAHGSSCNAESPSLANNHIDNAIVQLEVRSGEVRESSHSRGVERGCDCGCDCDSAPSSLRMWRAPAHAPSQLPSQLPQSLSPACRHPGRPTWWMNWMYDTSARRTAAVSRRPSRSCCRGCGCRG